MFVIGHSLNFQTQQPLQRISLFLHSLLNDFFFYNLLMQNCIPGSAHTVICFRCIKGCYIIGIFFRVRAVRSPGHEVLIETVVILINGVSTIKGEMRQTLLGTELSLELKIVCAIQMRRVMLMKIQMAGAYAKTSLTQTSKKSSLFIIYRSLRRYS